MAEEQKRQRSDSFRSQHRELLELIDTLSTQLERTALEHDASGARATLSMLAGKLTIHLAMEDNGLYPRLLAHANLEVRTLADRFATEMGGILTVFKEYLARWPNAESIQANAPLFIHETRQIFAALRARIAKEDAQLFHKLDET